MSNPLIIERPNLQTRLQKFGRVSLAIFMWSLWLYLWLPLATAGLWFLGIQLAYTETMIVKNAEELSYSLINFASTLSIIIAIQYSWSLYNFLRFRNKIRRNPTPKVSNEELAQAEALSETYLDSIQSRRQIDVYHDDSGKILERC